LGISLDLKRVKNIIKSITLRVIILVGVTIAHKLALVRLPVILLKGLKLNSVALRPIVIEFKGSNYLGAYCFRVILMAGDYCSALGII